MRATIESEVLVRVERWQVEEPLHTPQHQHRVLHEPVTVQHQDILLRINNSLEHLGIVVPRHSGM